MNGVESMRGARAEASSCYTPEPELEALEEESMKRSTVGCGEIRRGMLVVAVALAMAVALACGPDESGTAVPEDVAASPDSDVLRSLAARLFGALPEQADSDVHPVTAEKISLGRMLYYEPRLSRNQDISCNSCHGLDNYGVDNEPTSPGHRGQLGERNSPTVYNAALHVAQFWDGRAADVEAQAKGPVLNPVEMALSSAADVEGVLRSIPGYETPFAAAFPADADPITFDNVALAIGAFERTLMTPSRFDAYVEGDSSALSADELAGLETFVGAGCTTCHAGPAFGGQVFQKLGLIHPYETADTGRHAHTGNEADRFFFKVPSLRNIAQTGPYLHDGSLTELPEVVRLMAWHQLGKELTEEDQATIVTFLGSLTGKIDLAAVAAPALPESGPATPGPDPS